MWRILVIVGIFIVLVLFAPGIVKGICKRIASLFKEEKEEEPTKSASEIIDDIKDKKRNLEEESKRKQDEAKKAQEESNILDNFLNQKK